VEQLRTLLVSDSLKEIAESSGSWEAGIPYEARTLLFKALNNLIERNLLSREFVRIGKWFVQPFEGGSADRPAAKTSHLRQVSGVTLLVSFTIATALL
jgi:mediator of RNA polymerase II transcription subunit 13